MNFETMNTQRKMILIAAAVGIISMFLPWVSLGAFGSVNGMHGNGILVFICLLVAGFFAFTGDQTANLTKTNWMITLIAGAVALIFTVWNFFEIGSLRGFGIYLALAACIAVIAFAYMHRSAGDSLQSGFDNLKNSFGNSGNTTTQTGTTTTTTPTTTVSHTTTNDTTRPTV